MSSDCLRRLARHVVPAAIAILVPGPAHARQVPAAEPAAAAGGDATTDDSWFARVAFSPSHVVAASDFQSGDEGARAVSIELGRQTNGSADWHRVYNYPSYGFGLYAARFGHDRKLGRPLAAYGFFSWPFPIARRAQLSADIGIGLSWNWNPFDPGSNP